MTYKVFVTFSWKAAEMIRKGEIIVNKWLTLVVRVLKQC